MQAITTIGFDIAKSVFQVHGVDAAGQVIVRWRLKRREVIAFFQKLPPCLVGIEACASSHYWSRETDDGAGYRQESPHRHHLGDQQDVAMGIIVRTVRAIATRCRLWGVVICSKLIVQVTAVFAASENFVAALSTVSRS